MSQVVSRSIQKTIEEVLDTSRKIVIIYGPRQVGKTTFIKSLLAQRDEKSISINGDHRNHHDILSSRDINQLTNLVEGYDLLFIDEAQNIPDIGLNLKILYESFEDLQIIVTGSSSLDLAGTIQEPLTGRTDTYHMYPLSLAELAIHSSNFDVDQKLEEYMTYGTYPEVVTTIGKAKKIKRLKEISTSYLYKDILQIANIKHSDKLVKLLKMLAYQIGSLVSLHEIGKSLQMSHETVSHYIDLLEQSFVLLRLEALSKNPRNEINKMSKVYFYDVGIRNSIIDNFGDVTLRNDKGAIWENFLIMERIKKMDREGFYGQRYFWRTYGGSEIDFIEFQDEHYDAFEFKYKAKRKTLPKSWSSYYDDYTYHQVHRNNYLEYVLMK